MIDIVELVKEAVEKNEIECMLCGKKHYALNRPYMAPTELPTDWEIVLKDGIYKVYNDDPHLINEKILANCIINMCNDLEGMYCALNVFFVQIMNEAYGSSPFYISREAIVGVLSTVLLNNKDGFMKLNKWMGAIEIDGLWGEIVRICRIMKEDFAIVLLPESIRP